MLNIFMLSALSITGSLILLCMGLSFLSQSLNALDYSAASYDAFNYSQNPLIKFNSKYYHSYRPKNSVLLTEKKWTKIEKGIAKKIGEAGEKGKAIGYAQALKEIKEKIAEESSSFPTNPYKILDVAANADKAAIRRALSLKLDLYALRNFTSLDYSFRELAEIRLRQVKEAYDKATKGYEHSGS